jgi:3-hydroxyacyl-CoA dehydrogenase
VGILPAGGGTTEMLIRATQKVMPGADPFLAVQQVFELIAMAKVTTSAAEARNWGFLRPIDCIVLNPDRLLEEAKALVLELAPGYAPSGKRHITVLGETALANLRAGAMLMCEGGQITPYEVILATKVAEVLTGGSSNRPEVVSEDYLLEKECESLLYLIGQEKTRERMANMLKTGKALRN